MILENVLEQLSPVEREAFRDALGNVITLGFQHGFDHAQALENGERVCSCGLCTPGHGDPTYTENWKRTLEEMGIPHNL